jgi:hypothetical protein
MDDKSTLKVKPINHLIAVLTKAMERIDFRGYFTVDKHGVWWLWRDRERQSLRKLRSVALTRDCQIILDLPTKRLALLPDGTWKILKEANHVRNHQTRPVAVSGQETI